MARNWDPRAALDFINSVVSFDPGSGKFTSNINWSPAYSGRNNAAQVRRTKKMYDIVQEYRRANAAYEMTATGQKGYDPISVGGGEYRIPDSGDPDWDSERVKADYLNFQLKHQGRSVEQIAETMANQEPGGWRGVVHDALDNPGGGALIRGLDIISRPLYALAEGFNRGVEHGIPTSFDESISHAEAVGSGLREGITGREKTSFGDALKENEILTGKPAAVAGFGLDVALDPTSYVTFGTSTLARNAAREGAEQTARQTVEQMIRAGTVRGNPLSRSRAFKRELRTELAAAGLPRRNPRAVIADINSSAGPHSIERAMRDKVEAALKDPFWSNKTQRQIRTLAGRRYRATQAGLGLPINSAGLKSAVKNAVESARSDFADKVGADVMDEIATRKALRETKTLDVRIAGKPILRSRVGGRIITKSTAAARGTRAGSALARTFRTDAEVGEALHRIQRQAQNVSAAQFEGEAKAVKRTFTELGLTKGQRQLIARAIETGDTKGFTREMVDGYDAAKRFFKEAFDRELHAGALSSSDWVDNYLYHVYREPNFHRGIGSWVKPTGRSAKKFPTLAQAEAAGARPLTDIADILVYRLAKSHRVAASHLMMRDIAARFGVSKIAAKKVPNRMLRQLEDGGLLVEASKIDGAGQFFDKGVYFDQDVASSIAKMSQFFSNDELISRFGRLFDQFQARMKFLQTAPNPGFHVRNTMSDMFINFLDGVTSIRPYQQALKLVTGKGSVSVKLRGGQMLDADDIVQLYDGMGLRAGFFHAEAGIVPGMGNRLLTGSGNVIRRGSEIREDLMRMAHFIDALRKVPKSSRIEDAAEIAAKRVRKYNFDYQDLTAVERRVFRRAVPFYTFMRKNVPLMLESYFTRPGRMIVPTKAQNALASMMGEDNRDVPLPGMISTTPEWISRIPGIEVTGLGPENDASFLQPDMPYNQLDALFGGFAEGQGVGGHMESGVRGLLTELLLEQSTPLIRGLAEYGSQTDLATGADLPQTPADAVINQLPVGRIAQPHLADVAPGIFNKSDRPASPTFDVGGTDVPENLLNWFTGLGFRKVTPARQTSELRRRQDIIEMILKEMREKAIAEQQRQWEEDFGGMTG